MVGDDGRIRGHLHSWIFLFIIRKTTVTLLIFYGDLKFVDNPGN